MVFGIIRGNGNECNFAQMACRMANCSRVVFVSNTTNKITDFDYFNVILGAIYNILCIKPEAVFSDNLESN